MKKQSRYLLLLIVVSLSSCSNAQKENLNKMSSNQYNQLTKEEERVIVNKGTDRKSVV